MTTSNQKYRLVCGLEIHAELKTVSKMFCGCTNNPFHAEQPNSHTCPVCLGMPGGLPVPNKKAIEQTIKLGLAVGSSINQFSKFDRKNYFYPDLAKGYQISQYDIPFCEGGVIDCTEGKVRITRIHLEEDTGKLLHDTVDGKRVTLVDFNRSGVPLIEIVSEPDITTPLQAKEYAKSLRELLKYLNLADCDMEQGGMRLEANISLIESDAPPGALPNYKVEVKNINSFRFMEQAILYEMNRQEKILESGATPVQETRGWDSVKNCTYAQRAKEDAADYRYFPDPDIPPIEITDAHLESLKKQLPQLPHELRTEWESKFSIPQKTAKLLSSDALSSSHIAEVFEVAMQSNCKPLDVANAIVNKKIPYSQGMSAQEIVDNYKNISKTDDVSTDELTEIIAKIVSENPDAVAKFKNGETKVIGFFMGQVARASDKKLDPIQVQSVLTTELSK
ncbi:MAG: Asp-tRNA(Asn)/Glu-tRNA(Gln) amidotransferase subunit GatB [Microgenomates group bacterium]